MRVGLTLQKLDLPFKTLKYIYICMPKSKLANGQGPTYSYAKIVREATLANKRIGIMTLTHIFKFILKNLALVALMGHLVYYSSHFIYL